MSSSAVADSIDTAVEVFITVHCGEKLEDYETLSRRGLPEPCLEMLALYADLRALTSAPWDSPFGFCPGSSTTAEVGVCVRLDDAVREPSVVEGVKPLVPRLETKDLGSDIGKRVL